MRCGHLGLQGCTQFCAALPKRLSEGIHDTCKGICLLPCDAGIALQNIIAATQCTLVTTQRMQVIRKHLARGEVEKSTPMLRATAQQTHVAMIHPYNNAGGCEIVGGFAASSAIEREATCGGGLRITQAFAMPVSLHQAGGGTKAHQFGAI